MILRSFPLFALLLFSLPLAAQENENPVVVESSLHAAEVTDGESRSYCVYQDDALQFILLSKHAFSVEQGEEPTDGRLNFEKAKLAEAHSIGFSLTEDTLVATPPGNLVFHYALTRSRVFVIEFDFHGFSPIIRQIPVKMEPVTSPEILTKESAGVFQWLANADEAVKWEYSRERVPDSNYEAGEPVNPDDRSIIWGAPNDVGLRLGIGGLQQNGRIPTGQKLPVKQFIRNDGPETLRLSPTGLILSHRATGHTGTHTWAVDQHGNWPTTGSTWNTRDPAGEFLAAWDEGGTRLWYVDSLGIQRLNIAERFQDGGFWPMAHASDDLAGMPDGVRTALDLPAKENAKP
ncbi:MAG: hypothetical protein ACI9R3_005188 [Verrucomicrobiales bacterium]|jgi:hypothetical protein